MTEYNGWKNRSTWNVVLWLGNEYPLSLILAGYATYKTPYLSLRADLKETFGYVKTKDNVSLWDSTLDIPAINNFIRDFSCGST